MISSLSWPVKTVPSTPVSLLLLPYALLPAQFCGWHWPKQTRMLHWNLMLLLAGNLKALNTAVRTPNDRSYSHSPKIDGSVAHPLSSVTRYSFSPSSSIVWATVRVHTVFRHGQKLDQRLIFLLVADL